MTYESQIERLDNLGELFASYPSEGYELPNDKAKIMARKYLDALNDLGVVPEAVNPSLEGSVCIEWGDEENYDVIECWNTGEAVRVCRRPGQNKRVMECESGEVEPHMIEDLLEVIL